MTHHLEVISGMKRWTLLAAFFAFVSIPISPSFAALPEEMGGRSIIEVAKKSTPAVVAINVKFPIQDRTSIYFNGQEYKNGDPFDFFNDPFLQQFFGQLPQKESSAPQRFQTGQASGFIVSPEGHIVTNAHVVQNAQEITILLTDGREFKARVLGSDENTDIAIVKIDAKNLPYLMFGNSEDLEVGQWVVAIGNPLGLQASVTAGIVSAKGRNNLALARIEDFIQTDAAINRGNSGGPLLSLNSQVVGMNTAIVTNMGSGGYMGIGFAIPSTIIKKVMEELIQTGSVTRGFIGVSLQQITKELAQALGLDKIEGALVSDVTKNSPAEKAGIKHGDVILEFNNKKIDSISTLVNVISLMKPGTNANLLVLRKGNKINASLVVGNNPEDGNKTSSPKVETHIGFELDNVSPEIAKKYGLANFNGAVITSVQAGSPAALAGLRPGSVIVAVNHKEIKSTEDFSKFVSEADDKRPILLLVKQGDYIHFVSIKTN